MKRNGKNKKEFSAGAKLFIIGAVLLVPVVGFFAWQAFGGTVWNKLLSRADTIDQGLVGHWTFDGKDTATSSAIAATGGTITYSGGYAIHTFTSSGTFTVTSGSGNVEYLVVAGGGGGGTGSAGGGGGAGGVRTSSSFAVTTQAYTVTVGTGGGASTNGSDSVFGSVTATGGGAGGATGSSGTTGATGGSGGGGGGSSSITTYGGNGNTPSTSPSQGNNGAGNGGSTGSPYPSGGGGGAGSAGVAGSGSTCGNGGAGVQSSISGTATYYGGGGGGGNDYGATQGTGGTGGGGNGGTTGTNGTSNTGGGGGGEGGSGGSGIVIVRYLDTPYIINDVSGSGHNATTTGTTKTPGRIGQALSFDGTDDYISVGNVGSGIKSVSFWIKADNITKKILDLNGTTYVEVSSGTITATGFTSPTIYVDGAVSSTINTEWHHVTITSATGINASAVDIGRVSSGYFDGALDDVRMYSRVITADEVSRIYHLGATTKIGATLDSPELANGLMAHYTFDGRDIATSSAIAATGGTITYSGGYAIHTFISSGTFTVTSGSGNVEYLVVAGGGGGGTGTAGGGGGGGGVRTSSSFAVTTQAYTVTVGTGGGASTNGSDSVFGSVTATGGGYGGFTGSSATTGVNGGSGGGGGGSSSITTYGGNGNTPSTSPSQGNNGAGNGGSTGSPYPSGGGGGAGSAGVAGSGSTCGNGGAGVQSSISGIATYYGGGGGGGNDYGATQGTGGTGGGGNGGTTGTNGTSNTGGGGGGEGGSGGSGIVIVRYLDTPYIINDISGSGHNATTTGTTQTPGRIGQALSLDGTDDYASVGNVGSVNSVSFWIKADNTTKKIIDLNGSAYVEVSSGTITATGWTSPTIYVDGAVSSTIDTNWHHVVITTASTITASAVDIGRVSTGYFDGKLDDVRFYSRVLSAGEVSRIYHLGATTKLNTTLNRSGTALEQGLVGHWSFDGRDMTPNIRDTSGQGNHGNLSGQAATTTAIGKIGQALLFDGTNDSVIVLDSDSLDLTDHYTLSVWVKRDTVTSNRDFLSKRSGENCYGLNFTTTNDLNLRSGNASSGCTDVDTNVFIVANEWHHVLVTLSGTSRAVYLDGVSVYSDTASAPVADSSNLAIGSNASGTIFFGGSLDDVRIYNRALSASEILRLYQMGN